MKNKQIQFAAIALVIANILLQSTQLFCQSVGVNGSGSTPNISALLDIDATGMSPKGILIPRIALTSATDAATIATPATSLLIYNPGTGGLSPAGYYYNQGTSGSPNWVPFLTNNVNAPAAWSITGNTGTTASASAIGVAVDNNFIGTTDTKAFVLATNNLERMRISSGGNIGIGTTNPVAKLDVDAASNSTVLNLFSSGVAGSNIQLTHTGATNPNKYLRSFSGKFQIINSAYSVALFTVEDAGNVGIGLTTPASRLHVYNSNPTITTNSYSQFLPTLTADQATNLISQWNDITTGSSFNFSCSLFGAVNRVHLLAGQTGTVATTYGSVNDLYNSGTGLVSNAYGSTHSLANQSTGTITNGFGLYSGITNSGGGTITNAYGVFVDLIQATNKWSIYASDATAPNYFAGSVGIGTPSPVVQFANTASNITDALGLGLSGPNAIGWVANGSGYGIAITNSSSSAGANGMLLKITATDVGSYIAKFESGGTNRLTVRADGKVGIGTGAPAYTLDVCGDIRASGSVYYGGTCGTANGTLYTKPDFVFAKDYTFYTPDEVEKFIHQKGHLPWLTSAKKDEKENKGAINMTRMSFETLEAVENMQLQIIEQQKTIDKAELEISDLKKIVEQLAKQVDKVEKK